MTFRPTYSCSNLHIRHFRKPSCCSKRCLQPKLLHLVSDWIKFLLPFAISDESYFVSCVRMRSLEGKFFVILTFVATNKAAASVEVKPPRETLLEFPQIKFELIRSGRKSFSITFCFRRDLDRALSIFRF